MLMFAIFLWDVTMPTFVQLRIMGIIRDVSTLNNEYYCLMCVIHHIMAVINHHMTQLSYLIIR